MKNVAVFFGGNSCEHDVSVITGVLTLNSIDKTLYNPIPIYVTKCGEWLYGQELFDVAFYKYNDFRRLKRVTFVAGDSALYIKGRKLKKLCDVYSAINCMHGLNGEDGSLSGLFKLYGIPLVGSGLFASSFSMDKSYTKMVLKGLKVNVLPSVTVNKSSYLKRVENTVSDIEKQIGYPVIVKPANLGSSIGISTAFNEKELMVALSKAFKYDQTAIIEKYLEEFVEYNVAVCKVKDGIKLSKVEKPARSDKILTFDDKYENYSGMLKREFPAKISPSLENKLKNTSEAVYRLCGFSGVIRIDYIYSNGKLYLNEINTVPGSMAYYLFVETLKDYTTMLTMLIEESVSEHNFYKSNVFSYSSGVLKIGGGKGGKRLTSKN